MPELLVEYLSEEIPAGMQLRAKKNLKEIFDKSLTENRFEGYSLKSFVGPRRITIVASNLPLNQETFVEEKKGPSVSAPANAINGFLRSNAIDNINKLEIRELKKGKFYFLVRQIEGMLTSKVLESIIEESLKNFSWPKSMKWASGNSRWVRPLRNILAIFDGKVVPVSFAGVNSSNKTYGHRFLSPDKIVVKDFSDYKSKLLVSRVIVDDELRYKEICSQIHELSKSKGLELKEDKELVNELTGIVEWPKAYLGNIDNEFMDIPKEVLSSAMRKHQRYLALFNSDNSLSSKYIIVSNIDKEDSGTKVIKGNDRVLRARLSDAKFFWDQDKKISLELRVNDLKKRIFQSKLGTLFDKVKRLEKLAENISKFIPNTNFQDATRAALLCKSDLLTGVVGEFPDLQGQMGYYYSKNDGENESVSQAIRDHYKPVGPFDETPNNPNSICLSITDKIDTIVGFFGISQIPSGSKDPYALRRSTLGIIRIIIENRLSLKLKNIILQSHKQYNGVLEKDSNELTDLIISFANDRLRVFLKDKGVNSGVINAVFSSGDDLLDTYDRVFALTKFLDTTEGKDLLFAYRRAVNIVYIEEKKENINFLSIDNIVNLDNQYTRSLEEILTKLESEIDDKLNTHDFDQVLMLLALLKVPINNYLDNVIVNVEDVRIKRTNLWILSRVGRIMDKVAKFSMIEG